MRVASFLTTASVLSMLAVSPALAQASGGLTVEATGSFVLGSNEASEAYLNNNGASGTDDLNGGYGSISVGSKILPMVDLTARFSATSLGEVATTFVDDDGFDSSSTSDFDYQTLDIEAGFSPELDDELDIRFFAGARVLHYDASLATAGTFDKLGTPIDFDTTQDNEFYGVGPRVGGEFEKRFGDSPIGISGMAAGAVIFGRENTDTENTFTGATSDERDKTVVNLEIAGGVDYHATEQVKVTLGYRAEYLNDVNDFTTLGSGEGQLSHGPFAKVKASF